MILAIDPGSEKSGWIQIGWDGEPRRHGLDDNEDLLVMIERMEVDDLAVEYTPPYVMRNAKGGAYVPSQVFDTAFYCGRLAQEWFGLSGDMPALVPRRDVLKHITGKGSRVGDKEVRAALIERWGGKERAIGTKAAPGPLYGVKSHIWAALGVGLTFYERGSDGL